MAGRVLALVHWEGVLLLWVQEVAHVLVGGLDAVGGDLGIGAGGEGLWLFLLLFSGGPFFVLPFWVGGYGVLSGLVGLEQGDG